MADDVGSRRGLETGVDGNQGRLYAADKPAAPCRRAGVEFPPGQRLPVTGATIKSREGRVLKNVPSRKSAGMLRAQAS